MLFPELADASTLKREVVEGLEDITEWAVDHHETLSGSGYPFHKADNDLCAGSRILAIADIFTAVAEDRPYRAGMSREKVTAVLQGDVRRGALDERFTVCLLDNYAEIDGARMAAQRTQEHRLVNFWISGEDDAALIAHCLGGTPAHGAGPSQA